MFIRKFYGQNMKAVLQQAKQELGEDVVILSQKSLGKDRIELTAAVDQPQGPRRWDRDLLGEELDDIKQMLLSLVEGQEIMRLGKPALLLYRELKQKGMSESGAHQVVRELAKGVAPDDLMKTEVLRAELGKLLATRIQTTQPLQRDRMCIALLGRTGVGKTTTLAKLASMERFLHRRSVAVLSLDAWKVGSRDELTRIGKLLDIPTAVAYERSEIAALFERFKEVDTLFVDTPGKGLQEKGLRERIFDVMALRPQAQFHLLLSPNYQRDILSSDLEEYSRLSLKSLIVTKVDETRSIGGLVDAVLAHPVPLSWMTTGQDIPHDILPANKGMLLDMMVEA